MKLVFQNWVKLALNAVADNAYLKLKDVEVSESEIEVAFCFFRWEQDDMQTR